MPLHLSDSSQVATLHNAEVSVDNMTWWFWIKAGMGLTIGMLIMGALMTVFWLSALLGAALVFGRPFGR